MRGFRDVAARPGKLAELDVRPCGCFRFADRRGQRESHRGQRAAEIATELAGIGNPCVGVEIGFELRHPIECGEGLAIPSELDEGIADDAVVACRGRR